MGKVLVNKSEIVMIKHDIIVIINGGRESNQDMLNKTATKVNTTIIESIVMNIVKTSCLLISLNVMESVTF